MKIKPYGIMLVAVTATNVALVAAVCAENHAPRNELATRPTNTTCVEPLVRQASTIACASGVVEVEWDGVAGHASCVDIMLGEPTLVINDRHRAIAILHAEDEVSP